MSVAGRIACGAVLGLVAAVVGLVAAVVVLVVAELRFGVRYSDEALAQAMLGVLMAAPIVGAWLGWVRGS